jgi:hypothetical protein
LVAAGVPPLEVADLLGHADTRMLERYYRHRLQPVVTAGPVALAALVPETTAARPSEREVDSSSQPKPG